VKAHIVRGDKRRDSLQYWEKRLQRMGLGMEAGHVDWIEYGHLVNELDYDGKTAFRPRTERVRECDEWPVSLS